MVSPSALHVVSSLCDANAKWKADFGVFPTRNTMRSNVAVILCVYDLFNFCYSVAKLKLIEFPGETIFMNGIHYFPIG